MYSTTNEHVDRWDWRGSCSKPGMNPDWWDVLGRNLSADNRRAILICLSCPVKEECWNDVLQNPSLFHGTIRDARVVAAPTTLRRRKRKAQVTA